MFFLLEILDDTKPDPRTVDFLEKTLQATNATSDAIEGIAKDLVLREIYQDEIALLKERIHNLQRSENI